jgi:nucleotide-binding universal stress UspA family protein
MEMEGKPAVVVPLDGSRASALALEVGRAVTSIMEGELHVVHVTEASVPEERLLEYLKVSGDFDYVPHCLCGEIAGSIIELAGTLQARVIVMSSHGQSHNMRKIVGGNARGLAQISGLPVLIVRPGPEPVPGVGWKPRKMLVPLEGTPLPDSVVDQLFYLAQKLGADIDVLHIAALETRHSAVAGAYSSPRYLDHPYYDWTAWMDEFTKRFAPRRPPAMTLRLFHEQGNPVEATLNFASRHEADIIALNWHGRMDGKHAATVKGVLRRTRWPVLLLRAP